MFDEKLERAENNTQGKLCCIHCASKFVGRIVSQNLVAACENPNCQFWMCSGYAEDDKIGLPNRCKKYEENRCAPNMCCKCEKDFCWVCSWQCSHCENYYCYSHAKPDEHAMLCLNCRRVRRMCGEGDDDLDSDESNEDMHSFGKLGHRTITCASV